MGNAFIWYDGLARRFLSSTFSTTSSYPASRKRRNFGGHAKQCARMVCHCYQRSSARHFSTPDLIQVRLLALAASNQRESEQILKEIGSVASCMYVGRCYL